MKIVISKHIFHFASPYVLFPVPLAHTFGGMLNGPRVFLYGTHDHLYEPLTKIEIKFYMVYGSQYVNHIFE